MLEQGADLWAYDESRRLLDAKRELQRFREWVPPSGYIPRDDEAIELAMAAERGRDAMRALQGVLDALFPEGSDRKK